MSQEQLTVLMVGDSPLIQTGFGRVNSRAARAFLRKGWKVQSVTGLQSEPLESELSVEQFVPSQGDELGVFKVIELLESGEVDPDVVYMTGDPGTVTAMSMVVPSRIPFFAYVPIEGEPIVESDWRNLLSTIDFMTCTAYGAGVVATDLRREVDWVYHGVDPTKFFPMEPEERQAYRERLGWADKFVIITVAQNVRRKQLPRLIEAVAYLKGQFKQRDVLLYMHTVPFQRYWLEGWKLFDIAAAYGVTEEVVFNPLMAERGSAVPEVGNMDIPGVRELLCAADLFVLPSQVEGFGLPIAEAMACGTPVMVTRYGAGWEVARLGGGVGIPVHDWEIHKSGTKYANVDPYLLAKEILSLKRNPRRLAQMSAKGIEASKQFDWGPFEEKVVGKIEDAVARAKAGGDESPEASGGGPEAGSPPGVLRETSPVSGPEAAGDSASEQGQDHSGSPEERDAAEVDPQKAPSTAE